MFTYLVNTTLDIKKAKKKYCLFFGGGTLAKNLFLLKQKFEGVIFYIKN